MSRVGEGGGGEGDLHELFEAIGHLFVVHRVANHHGGYLVVAPQGVFQTHHPLLGPAQSVPHRDLQEPLLAVLDPVPHRLKHPVPNPDFGFSILRVHLPHF